MGKFCQTSNTIETALLPLPFSSSQGFVHRGDSASKRMLEQVCNLWRSDRPQSGGLQAGDTQPGKSHVKEEEEEEEAGYFEGRGKKYLPLLMQYGHMDLVGLERSWT